MDFEIGFSGIQSNDGKTRSFTDLSNWAASGLNRADFVRTFTLTDSDDQPIGDPLVLDDDTDVATIEMLTDKWVNVVFTVEGADDYTKTLKFPFNRNFVNKYQAEAVGDCCKNTRKDISMCEIQKFVTSMAFAEETGNAVQWQNAMDGATTLIDYINEW